MDGTSCERTDMSRSLFQLPLAEIAAVLGIFFGAWLIHNTFQPTADAPNLLLLVVGALDILLCFGLLAYLLRGRLRDEQALPGSWIVLGIVVVAGLLGWIGALLYDADRVLNKQLRHGEYLKQVASLESSLHHLNAVLPAEDFTVDAAAWKNNRDAYAVHAGQLHAALRTDSTWDKELTSVDAEVQQMEKLFVQLTAPNDVKTRLKWRADFAHARERAVVLAEKLRDDIGQAERGLAATHRTRWHGIGAAALIGVFLLLGCLLFWLIFDHELRRSVKAQLRLADSEARFRWVIENQSDPIAVLDAGGFIHYVNPAWQSAFGFQPGDLENQNLLDLIHPQDRAKVQATLQKTNAHPVIVCRMSADYGIWHDVEVECQSRDESNTMVVRVRDLRESSDVPIHPQADLLHDEKLKAQETRLAELEKENAELRERESKTRSELEHQQWLAGSHADTSADGLLILSARGEPVWWNAAFVRMWKLSNDTMTGHTWQTIAAHMESQVQSGWREFQRAVGQASPHAESAWEMDLEGGRSYAVQARAASHPLAGSVVQVQFSDVTRHKNLESQLSVHREQNRELEKRLSEHGDQKQSHEAAVCESEKRIKQLEKQLRERDRHIEELETAAREQQDRLHQLHESHAGHETDLHAAQEAMRRLASGVANDLNHVLSVVLGNTEVLRDNLPRDHVAQNYLEDIHQATGKGTELSQRLVAFSRNHLLQLVPTDINEQLASLEPRLRVALGHVQLQWQRGVGDLWAKTDSHPFEQAVLHLANHARAHMPTKGTLTIRTQRVQLSPNDLPHADMRPGAYIQIRLGDTGAGIDEETLPHVFEPYHPVIDGHKGDLTLATAHGIVRQTGGAIEVASEEGVGTEWTILLPETSERQQSQTLRVA